MFLFLTCGDFSLKPDDHNGESDESFFERASKQLVDEIQQDEDMASAQMKNAASILADLDNGWVGRPAPQTQQDKGYVYSACGNYVGRLEAWPKTKIQYMKIYCGRHAGCNQDRRLRCRTMRDAIPRDQCIEWLNKGIGLTCQAHMDLFPRKY